MNEHTAENDAPPWRCVNPRCALCASVIPPVKGDIA